MCPFTLVTCIRRHFRLRLFLLKNLFILNVNGVLCYFPHNVVLEKETKCEEEKY